MSRLISPRFLALLWLLCLAGGNAFAGPCCNPQDQNCLTPYEGTRVALIAGVNSYSGSKTPPDDELHDLINAVSDARAIADVLAHRGYRVRCLLNPSADRFVSELDLLKGYLSSLPPTGNDGNSTIVHFSGHGFHVGQADFIFLSGKYKQADFKNHVIRVDELVGAFSALGHLTIHFIIDACRNFSRNQPSWSDGGYLPTKEYNLKKNNNHGLFFAASASKLAHDSSESIGAKENGAFVHVANKYMDFRFADLELIYGLVRDDGALEKIDQVPDMITAGHYSARPMGGDEFDCARASDAVREFGACSRAPIAGPSCAFACTVFNKYLRTESGQSACRREPIDRVFSATQSCPPPDLLSPMAAVIGTTYVAEDRPVGTLADLRKEAQLVAATQRTLDLPTRPVAARAPAPKASVGDAVSRIQQLDAASPPPSRRSPAAGLAREVSALRLQILNATRDAAGPQGSFSEMASASLKAPAGAIELQLVPGMAGGTTGVIQPVAPPKIDCATQYCDANWVAVRVPIAKNKVVDGWIRSSAVASAQAAVAIPIVFVEDKSWPTQESFAELQKLADAAKQNLKSTIKLIAVTKPDDGSRSRADSRMTRVRSILDNRSLPASRITTRIIESEKADNFPALTVELLN